MLMVVDVGNTHTVIGIYNDDDLLANWRMSTNMGRTSDETWIMIKMWCKDLNLKVDEFTGVVISSVVPSQIKVFFQMSVERLKVEPLIISSEIDTGMKINYESPRSVGADRICNAIAGYRLYGGPLIVVDFGTATTFDVVSANGAYEGGIIALGLIGASEELHRLSAVLPRVALEFPKKVIGQNTIASMQSGILWGTLAMIDGLIVRVRDELKASAAKVIATGGLADVFMEKSKYIEITDKFLTLKGMQIIWQHQNKLHSREIKKWQS